MTILVYGEKASRTHENQMLQAFLEQLEERWATSSDWILVLANTMWSGAEIDLVCILPSAIIVADFKSHGGKLAGTENGPWQADGVLVKGGRKANPYQQLRDNKFSVLNWLQSKSLLVGRNLGHISAGVVFSRAIEDHLDLPQRVRSWFYPTDLDNCAVLLDSLASPELQIERKETLEIVQRLGVQPLEWVSSRPHVRDIDHVDDIPKFRTPLTAHQRASLQSICNFIRSPDIKTFSVLGMTSTGKSRILAETMGEIECINRQPIPLAPNRRLSDSSEVESNSIYSHIYIMQSPDSSDPKSAEEEKELKILPLRECEDPEDCIYLIDDAHLLGNSKFTTPDGKQYGSGRLLSDFFDFSEIGKSKRKIIFFGDPYQIQRAQPDESVLLGNFQNSLEISHQSIELIQIIDTSGGSAKLANAERLASAIRNEAFAALELTTDETFRHSQSADAAKQILDYYQSSPFSAWYLAETHRQVNEFTKWIRDRLHNKADLNPIEPGDLLEIYVSQETNSLIDSNISAAWSRILTSGSRVIASEVRNRLTYRQGLSWAKNGHVIFNSIELSVEGREQAEVHAFEEFLIAEKPELEKETAVAESVWRKTQKRDREKALQTKQTSFAGLELADIPDPPPEFTYARYGYASTVHHAQGMSQQICFLNCNHSAGRHSEGFFRWLYSALTIADDALILINPREIHPFDSAEWNTRSVKLVQELHVGAGWSFQPNGTVSERDQKRSLPNGIDQSKDMLKSVAIWLRVNSAAEMHGWQVARTAYHPFKEQLEISSPSGESFRISIAYDSKNIVKAMHLLDDPIYWPIALRIAEDCIDHSQFTTESKTLYQSAQSRLSKGEWRLVSVSIKSAYRMELTAAKSQDKAVKLEINFDKQGLASSVRAIETTDMTLLDSIKENLL